MNNVGVNLAQRDQRPQFFARLSVQVPQESGPVAINCRFGIVFGKPEVEGVFSVGAGRSSHTSGKSVDEPWELAQLSGAKDGNLVLAGSKLWH